MKKPSGLRICVASSGLGHVDRGVEAWAEDFGAELARRGEQVILCKGAGETRAPHERVIHCWTRTSEATRRLLRWLPRRFFWRLGLASHYGVEQTTFALGLMRQISREPVDILHVQDPHLGLVMQRAASLGIVSNKTVLMHGTEEPLEYLNRFDYLLHLAPWHRERAEAAGYWRPTWDVIPNFIDTQRFQPGRCDRLREELQIPRDALVLLVSAAIKRKHKRVDYLIREVEQVRKERPDLPLWLLIAGGRNHDTEALQEEAEARLGDRVRLLVSQPRERMPDIYRSADVLIHGSLKEMLGISLLEATASGLPCVVHEHPVMKWIIGNSGVAADLRQPGGLVRAILPLLDDSGLRHELGRRARLECVSRFSHEIVVDQLLDYSQRAA